jgi:hypothetical protein
VSFLAIFNARTAVAKPRALSCAFYVVVERGECVAEGRQRLTAASSRSKTRTIPSAPAVLQNWPVGSMSNSSRWLVSRPASTPALCLQGRGFRGLIV